MERGDTGIGGVGWGGDGGRWVGDRRRGRWGGADRVVSVGRVHGRRRADPEALRPALAALGAGERENGGCCKALARFRDGPLVGEGALRWGVRGLVDGGADGGEGLCGVDWDCHALERCVAECSELGGVARRVCLGGRRCGIGDVGRMGIVIVLS